MENLINWTEDKNGARVASWTFNGYDFKAKAAEDIDGLDCAADYLGKLAWRDEPGKIRFAALGLESKFKRACGYQRWYGNEAPAGYIPSRNYPEDTEENREYWKQDASLLLDHLCYDRAILYVSVTCSRAGVELGSSSLGGIDVAAPLKPEDEAEITRAAAECAAEAMAAAESKLAELRAS